MPGIHRNPTIAFRVDEWQRELISQRAALSGMLKCDYIAKSCIYSKIVVTGTKENIDRIVDAMINLSSSMSCIAGQFMSGNFLMSAESYTEMELEFLALAVTIVDILDGASYLYGLKPVVSDRQNWKESEYMRQYRQALIQKLPECMK